MCHICAMYAIRAVYTPGLFLLLVHVLALLLEGEREGRHRRPPAVERLRRVTAASGLLEKDF